MGKITPIFKFGYKTLSDIDPDILAQFQEQIELMTNLMSQSNAAMGTYASMMKDQAKLGTDLSQATKAEIDAINNQVNAIRSATVATKDLRDAETIANQEKSKRDANFADAANAATTGLRSFGGAILSGTQGVEKYGSALNSAGTAAMRLGENFGVLGIAIGFATQLFTKVAQDSLKLVDQTVNFRDSLTKVTGVMPITLENISSLSNAAKFSGERMAILEKSTAGLGIGLNALNGIAGQGADTFMKMAALGPEADKVRKYFGAMGVTQEQLLDLQSKYIQQQSNSGLTYSTQQMTVKQLTASSLEYAKSLELMSTLTHKNTDQIQQERDAVNNTLTVQLSNRRDEDQLARLTPGSAAYNALDAKIKSGNAGQAILSNTMDTNSANAYLAIEKSGVVGPAGVNMARLDPEGTRIALAVHAGKISAEEGAKLITDSHNKGYGRFADTLTNQAIQNPDLAAMYGVTAEGLAMSSKIGGRPYKVAEQQARDIMNAPPSKEASQQQDVLKTERDLQADYQSGLQKLIDTIGPFGLTGTVLVLNAAILAATVALGAMAATAGLNAVTNLGGGGKVRGFLGKLFGGGGKAALAGEAVEGAEVAGGAGAIAEGGALAAGGTALLPAAGAIAGNLLVNWAEKKKILDQQQGGWAKVLADAAGGAGTGALGGSLFAGVGAIPGAVLGGLGGAAFGLWNERNNLWGKHDGSPVASTPSDDASTPSEGESGLQSTDIDKLTSSFNKLNDAVIKATQNLNGMTGSSASSGTPSTGTSSGTPSTGTSPPPGSDPPGSDEHTGSGPFSPTIKNIADTIKHMESRGNYSIRNKTSTASGAYQFTDPTWHGLTNEYKIGQQYKSAADAPADVQDKIATMYVQEILAKNGGNINAVPNTWYTGNAAGKNSHVTPDQLASYDKGWMHYLNTHSGIGGYARMAEGALKDAGLHLDAGGSISKLFNFGGSTGDESHFNHLQPALK